MNGQAATTTYEAAMGAPGARAARSSARLPVPRDAALLNALTIIAHDLRGPLANISVLIELMEAYAKVQAWDRVAGSARLAQDTIDALSGLLNGFLERTRDTGDPLAFKPGLVDLGDVVRRAVALEMAVAESRGVALATEGRVALVVPGDMRLLVEAVGNLVGNAVKHAPAGSTVRCRIDLRDSGAIITVEDEGAGLSAADLARAFRPFASLNKRRRQASQPSFGLGLWIVRLIAERHGGSVAVVAGQRPTGASVEIALPASLIGQR